MPGIEMIKAFLQQASAKETKATVLKPLGWMIGILIAAIIGSASFMGPKWVVIMFSIFAGVTMALYLFAYLFCLFTDKDALRSETYSIQKLAIEKGFIGDNATGLLSKDMPRPSGFLDYNAGKAEKGGNDE